MPAWPFVLPSLARQGDGPCRSVSVSWGRSRRMPSIRVLLADDHALFRRGVASLLAAESDFEVVGEAVDGQQALEMARELVPDVILMDVSMPVMDGLAATRRIKAEIPCVRIVILTASGGDRTLFEAVKSGAQGYLLKNLEPQELSGTLRRVVRGEDILEKQHIERRARPVPPALR